MNTEQSLREQAIHLLRSGRSVSEVSHLCQRSERWVYKWQARYKASGWSGLVSQSQAPKRHGRKLSRSTQQAIISVRSELEAEAARGDGLCYIGPRAIRTRLKKKRLRRIPSYATIARVLKTARMSGPQAVEPKVVYPHLRPQEPLQLIQVDIVPHFLTGGQRVACFNAIDVVSRYPTGQAYARRRSVDAVTFLQQVWREIGLPTYTQVDNEGCFSGGSTHPYVLGKVVRLALAVGTDLLFSPTYHPKSNSVVERFHQAYNKHVWQNTYLKTLKQVRRQSRQFFERYRHSEHHVALNGQTPHHYHTQQTRQPWRPPSRLRESNLPLYQGNIHFLRRVRPDQTVSVLNVGWQVQAASPNQGVWVTLSLNPNRSTLSIYDSHPDTPNRTTLDTHLFPLTETVHIPQT